MIHLLHYMSLHAMHADEFITLCAHLSVTSQCHSFFKFQRSVGAAFPLQVPAARSHEQRALFSSTNKMPEFLNTPRAFSAFVDDNVKSVAVVDAGRASPAPPPRSGGRADTCHDSAGSVSSTSRRRGARPASASGPSSLQLPRPAVAPFFGGRCCRG